MVSGLEKRVRHPKRGGWDADGPSYTDLARGIGHYASYAGDFSCFDTPDNGRRCACVGSGECDEMLKSGDCKSKPHCDDGELGPIICSCKAAPIPAAGSTTNSVEATRRTLPSASLSAPQTRKCRRKNVRNSCEIAGIAGTISPSPFIGTPRIDFDDPGAKRQSVPANAAATTDATAKAATFMGQSLGI